MKPPRMLPSTPLVRRCAAAAAWLGLAAHAAATPLSFDAALERLNASSDQLAASRQAVASAQARRDAIEKLGSPSVTAQAGAYAYKLNYDIDLTQATQDLPPILGTLPPPVATAIGQMPTLPPSYQSSIEKTSATASVSAIWPIYTGGVFDAARGVMAARADEARADAEHTRAEATGTLAQRYFGAQLAARAAALRHEALRTIAEHDAAAQKMLDAGLIARVERLQAQAALENARAAARKAQDDADLAATALARTLKSAASITPTTPLFVHTQPLPGLPHFIDLALRQHPGLAKVAAKREEATQLHAASEAGKRPKVFAFGQSGAQPGGKLNYVAGVAVRWTLWDGIDRSALSASSAAAITQAEHADAQARNDIALLVERQWLAVENARRQYFAGQPGEDLAAEMLRLRQAGLREGTSTTLDLIDAQTQLAKVRTERAQAAHDYVKALADLLQTCGQPDALGQYAARADVQL